MSEIIQFIAEWLGIYWLDKFHILLLIIILFLVLMKLRKGKSFIFREFQAVRQDIANSSKKVAELYKASKDPTQEVLLTRSGCLNCLRQILESIENLHVALAQSQDEILELAKQTSYATAEFKRDGEKSRQETKELIHGVALDVRKVTDDLLGLLRLLIDRTTEATRNHSERARGDS